MTELVIPIILVIAGLHALWHQTDVMSALLRGAQTGLQTAIHILPTMIILLTAVRMLRASGWIDLAGQLLEPLLQKTGIPAECSALVLLKPLSGSGGLALGQEIMRDCGVDSYAGRVAAVMLGASETSLYTIGIYCGHLELKKTGYAIPAAILADFAAFLSAALLVRWLG